MLETINDVDRHIQSVAIGGINLKNAQELITGSALPTGLALDGLAIVSAIIASPDPKSTCEEFIKIIKDSLIQARSLCKDRECYILDKLLDSAARIRKKTPMVHHITSNANIYLYLELSYILLFINHCYHYFLYYFILFIIIYI